MSSTPVRRTGPSARPRPRPVTRTPRRPARAETLVAEAPTYYGSAMSRAFALPMVKVTTDTLVLGGFALVALLLRLIMLGDRALHHDESLHATYSWYMMGQATPHYHYDPMMHGPLQFHMIALFYSIFGSSPFAARLWSTSAGTALVLAPWLLRRQLGRPATYVLMGIFCLSPICLYISRFAREDMQYGLFVFLMLAALVRYVVDRREELPGHYRWLYLVAASFTLSYAAKETIYLTVATVLAFLGAQLAWEVVRDTGWWAGLGAGLAIALGGLLFHALAVTALGALLIGGILLYLLFLNGNGGPLSDAMLSTPVRAWGLAGAIVAVLFVLFYWPIGDPVSWAFVPGSNPVHTTLDIAGGASKPYTYSTDGLLGGLQYWQAQVPVARGLQPWYYYFFVLGLYEWLVVPFAIVGAVHILRRQRNFFTLLFLWYVVATFGIYAWASEKMPWNAVHLVIPTSVLAAIGLVAAVRSLVPWRRYLAVAAAVVTGAFTLHNSVTLAYVNGANPVELMVYVQTTQDVPEVYSELQRIQPHAVTATDARMHIIVDSEDEWPWVYYLRDPAQWATDKYAASTADYANAAQPALIVGGANYAALKTQFAAHYVAIKRVLRWWNPEEYKIYANPTQYDSKGNPHTVSRLGRAGNFLRDAASPGTWGRIMNWEIGRQPFNPHAWDNDGNQLIFYFLVRNDMVQYLSPSMQAVARAQQLAQQKADPFYTRAKQPQSTGSFGAGQGKVTFGAAGPIAVDAQGTSYVVDPNNERVLAIGANGTLLRTIGGPGAGNGQFHFPYGSVQGAQTGGVAVAPNGHIYVADTWNHRVQEFTADGRFVNAFGRSTPQGDQAAPKPGEFYGPRGLAVAPNGDVYIADTGNRRIQVFTGSGQYRFSIGGGVAGSGIGQLREPSSVAIGGNRLYVADYWNGRIQEFDLQGHPIAQFAVSYWQSGSYDEPGIAVDASGRVYVPDVSNARVLVYTSDGQPLSAITGSSAGATFGKPYNVAIGPRGELLISDMGNNRVLRLVAP